MVTNDYGQRTKSFGMVKQLLRKNMFEVFYPYFIPYKHNNLGRVDNSWVKE